MQVLDVLFPELRLVFRKSTTQATPLHLLWCFPTAEEIAAASEEAELHRVIVHEARRLRHRRAAALLKALAQETVGVREGVQPLRLAQGWLTHHAHILLFKGESYRFRQSQQHEPVGTQS